MMRFKALYTQLVDLEIIRWLKKPMSDELPEISVGFLGDPP